jgi:uncharacterized protein YbjT (DUF2867 family)
MLLRALLAAALFMTAGSSLPQDASPSGGARPLALVAGGTGRTGRYVVEGLIAEGRFAVRVLARDADKARELFGDRVDVAVGDVKEPGTLPAAFAGVTHVVSAIGTGGDFFGDNRAEFVDYAGNRNLAEAAAAAGVQHFVLVSSIGVTHPDHPLNARLNNILDWKLKGENALRASGVPYTIVRPGGLRDEPGGRFGLKVAQGDAVGGPEEYIPRADVAAVCVRALGNPDAFAKTFEVLSDPGASEIDWSFFARLEADAAAK